MRKNKLDIAKLCDLFSDKKITGVKISVVMHFNSEDERDKVEIAEELTEKIFELTNDLGHNAHHITTSLMNDRMIRKECTEWT